MRKLLLIIPLVLMTSGCGSYEIDDFWYTSVNFDYQFHEEIRPTVDKAMEDGKITWDELKEIQAARHPQPTSKERLNETIRNRR